MLRSFLALSHCRCCTAGMAALITGLLLLTALFCAPGASMEAVWLDSDHQDAFQETSGNVNVNAPNLKAFPPVRVPLEVHVVLVGFNGDGGYRYFLESSKLQELLKKSMRSHRPAYLETGQLLAIQQELVYKVISTGHQILFPVEWKLRSLMQEAGVAKVMQDGQEVLVPAYEVEATHFESILEKIYVLLFNVDPYSDAYASPAVPTVIFILNPDKVRMDPRIPVDASPVESVIAGVSKLDEKQLQEQEGGYVYRYRYNGGGRSQVWLGRGRYAVVDLAAGPCSYGRIHSEEGSVGYRSLPRIRNLLFPRGRNQALPAYETQNLLTGQLSTLVASAIEQVISPDVRFEIADDVAQRLLVAVIVLQNHRLRNLNDSTSDFGINMTHVGEQVRKLARPAGHEVVVVGGVHSLHEHPRLSIAVHKALRGMSVREAGHYGLKTRTYLDGAILREEMLHTADVLAAGLLGAANPALSREYFRFETIAEGEQAVITASPAVDKAGSGNHGSRVPGKSSTVRKSSGTRVVPVFVLSLAGFDENLMMGGESLWWASRDSVFVLQHGSEVVPLTTFSENKRLKLNPRLPERHIVAGLASVVGGLVAPYEKASHGRAVIKWLWACGHHPFGPFANTSSVSGMMMDTSLRNRIYAQVDMAFRHITRAGQKEDASAAKFLLTPLGEPVGRAKKTSSFRLDDNKLYTKTTNLPEPTTHDHAERLAAHLNRLEAELYALSASLHGHHLLNALRSSSSVLQSAIFAEYYVEKVFAAENERMRCCRVEYSRATEQDSQAFTYGGLFCGVLLLYFLVIYAGQLIHYPVDRNR